MADKEYIADEPVSKEAEDRFHRYNFARRIAQTIINRENRDGVVIGIYGAWGEGKTSVINFIDTELIKNEDIIRIKFNPWRYSDENTLLYSFFCKVSTELGAKLLKRKERIGKWLSKHSSAVNYNIPKVGDVSKAIGSIGNLLGGIELETLKNRLEEIIIKSNKKVVIFIDDIDRLDKNEIHSVFRLVKLTANFSNTIYILSFDESVVSSVIGERYATSDIDSGRNFLDKIIQVPLNIPKAQPDSLRDYCFQIINDTFNSNKLNLLEEESRRFVRIFTSSLLYRFNTPRMIVRYGNSLSFSLPLLNGEVNMVDLMLIEAIKIIYPKLYDYISNNPDSFTKKYTTDEVEKRESIKTDILTLLDGHNKREKDNINELIENLFPLYQTITNNIDFPNRQYDSWYKEKRIASHHYFKRYFSYSVIKGELSDILFNDFITQLPKLSIIEIEDYASKLIDVSSVKSYIYKIRIFEKEFDWGNAMKLSKALSNISNIFTNTKDQFAFFNSQTSRGQLAIFISQLIRNHDNIEEKLSFSKELMSEIKEISFAFDVLRWLTPNEKEELNNIFTVKQFTEIWSVLNNRILKEADKVNIFDKFSEELSCKICKFWEGYDKKGFNSYLKRILNKEPQKIITILRTYQPRYSSWGSNSFRDGDLERKTYDYIISILDKENIIESLLKIYPNNELDMDNIKWSNNENDELSDIDIASQFYYWYNLDKSEKEN